MFNRSKKKTTFQNCWHKERKFDKTINSLCKRFWIPNDSCLKPWGDSLILFQLYSLIYTVENTVLLLLFSAQRFLAPKLHAIRFHRILKISNFWSFSILFFCYFWIDFVIYSTVAVPVMNFSLCFVYSWMVEIAQSELIKECLKIA